MACSIEKIKKDSIARAKGLFIGEAKEYEFKGQLVSIPVNKFGLAAAKEIAQQGTKRIENWAKSTFGEIFSKGWTNIQSSLQSVDVNILFPENLERAYEIKTGVVTQNSNVKTLTEPLTLHKGLGGKYDVRGNRINVHYGVKGRFFSTDYNIAKEYDGGKGIITETLPVGTTVERIDVRKNVEYVDELRPAEIEAINNSKADIVELGTFDGEGNTVQYIIKDTSLEKVKDGLQWLKQVMPDVEPVMVDGLIDSIANGSYDTVNDLITLSRDFANKQVVKEEAFHRVFNLLPKSEQEKLLNEGSKRYGIARGKSTATVKYSQADQNKVDFSLKAVEILQSDKAKQVFAKGEKAGWDLTKILTELAIPKEQKQLILDLGKTNREQIITDLLANYSYTIDINTAKENANTFNKIHGFDVSNVDVSTLKMEETDWGGSYLIVDANGNYLSRVEYSKEEAEEILAGIGTRNTAVYSNLTVPGGTNYTERNFETPLIKVPKSHAQFNTENTIGFTRGDDRVVYTENDIDKLISIMQSSGILEIKCN
jgi:hypothetical protein